MSRRIAPVWALLILTLAGPAARAQVPFATDLVPKRSTLARLGLERQWTAVIPLYGTERLLRISRSSDLFFAQTDHGAVHTYNAETGQLMWSASVGETHAARTAGLIKFVHGFWHRGQHLDGARPENRKANLEG